LYFASKVSLAVPKTIRGTQSYRSTSSLYQKKESE
jgi:hypothetical protein